MATSHTTRNRNALIALAPWSSVCWTAVAGAGVLLTTGPAAGQSAAELADRENQRLARAAFGSDARLQGKVTLAWKDRPLGTALAELGKQLGAPLSADRDTTDEKVTLFVKERPAAEVLTLLSRHFDYQWFRSAGKLVLTQNVPSRRREQALQDAEVSASLAADLARLETVRRLSTEPREPREARRKEVDERLKSADLTSEERARLTEERQNVAWSLSTEGQAVAAVAASLAPTQLDRLRAGGRLRLSTQDGSLSPELAAMVGVGARAFGVRHGFPAEGRPLTATEAEVRLDDRGDHRLEFQLRNIHQDGDPAVPSGMRFGLHHTIPRAPSLIPPTRTDDPQLIREVELKLPPSPDEKRPARAILTGMWRPGWVPLSDVCEALQGATGLELLADSYTPARIDRKGVQGRKRVVELLDLLAAETRTTWSKEGSVVRLRSRRFPEYRRTEAPDGVVRPWGDRVVRQPAPTLDDLAELVLKLTDRQLKGLVYYWGWYFDREGIPPPHPSTALHDGREHLRLWAALTAAQRETLRARRSIQFNELDPRQRNQLLTALFAEDEEGPSGTPLRYTPTPDELAQGWLRLNVLSLTAKQRGLPPNPDGRPIPGSRSYGLWYYLPGERWMRRDQVVPARTGHFSVEVPPEP